MSQAMADLDGDGRLDRFLTYGILDPRGQPNAWFARAILASSRRSDAPIEFVDSGILPGAIGAADADGDGRAEVFVVVDHGASTMFVGVYHVVDGKLTEVQLVRSGQRTPARFDLNGSVTHGGGIECRRSREGLPAIVSLGVSAFNDDLVYEWSETTYRWVGGNLHLVGTTDKGMRKGSVKDPEFQRWLSRFYELRCGDLATGGEINFSYE